MENASLLNWKTLGPAGLSLLAMVVLMTSCAGGGGVVPVPSQPSSGYPPTNSISVSGSGEAYGTPDIAYIQLGVDTAGADLGQAVAQNNSAMERVKQALLDAGIAQEDLQTTNFNVWIEDKTDPQTGQLTGERVYHVQNTLNITVRDIAKIGDVIDAALNAGANTVYGLTFGISDTTALESEARRKAVEDARTRAQELADALGVRLGNPIIVSESTGGGIVVPMFAVEAAAGRGGGAPPINQGQMAVTVSVSVVYSISQ
jgi:uncharacterized protein YggE